MKMKRVVLLLVVCFITAGNLLTIVKAENVYDESVVQMEDMCREMIDISQIEYCDRNLLPRITYLIRDQIPGQTIHISDEKISLIPRQIVTINCSYSPSATSVDFGVIAPDGYFYFLNAEGGSINRSIRVNQSGDYAVAIRNNSSHSISVVGYVEY